jgi:hypothetical protein
MTRFRCTIAGLLSLVLFLALGFAALRQATDLWDSAVVSATLVVLSASVLLTVHRTESKRAFWLGFALLGWIYFGASWIPAIEAHLLTTKGLAYLDSQVPGRDTATLLTMNMNLVPKPGTGGYQTFAFSGTGSSPALGAPVAVQVLNANTGAVLIGSSGTTENFLRIGHSILALVFAYVGGHFSRWLFARGRTATSGGALPPAVVGVDDVAPRG